MDKQQLGTTVVKILDKVRERPIPLGISNRYIHPCAGDYGRLSPNHPTNEKKGPLWSGQYAAEQTVTLVGSKGQSKNVRLLGSPRSTSRVEISCTNACTLGTAAPPRISGNIQDTPGVRLISLFAELDLVSGVIVVQRHIHMSPLDALISRVSHDDKVLVAIDGDERRLIFDNVAVHASLDMRPGMHINIDEANTAGADSPQTFATLVTSR